MKKFLTILFLLTASFVVDAAVPATRKIVYKETPQGELQLHIFSPQGHKKTDKKPVLILFPGGAWDHGTPWFQYPQAEYLASRGLVVVIPQIRSKKNHRTDPRASVMDAKSAIRWVRSHAGKLGIDPHKLGACGGDEGGHLAAATATLDSFNEPDEDRSISCVPQALILFNPFLDNSENGYGYDKVKDYWDRFSPLNNVQKSMPPTLIIQSTEQLMAPISSVEAFKQKLTANGNRCDLQIIEGQPASFHWQEDKRIDSIKMADDFLINLGWMAE